MSHNLITSRYELNTWVRCAFGNVFQYFLSKAIHLLLAFLANRGRTEIEEKVILVNENGLFLTLGSGTSNARIENPTPPLHSNILLISGKYGQAPTQALLLGGCQHPVSTPSVDTYLNDIRFGRLQSNMWIFPFYIQL